MISMSVAGYDEVLVRLEKMPERIRSNIGLAAAKLAFQLQQRVVDGKLSGQVLKRQTGNLARSVQQQVITGTDSVAGEVFSRAKYARIHEYGGVIVPRKAKALRFQIGGRWVITKKVTMPERSYMRSSLREMEAQIRTELERAALEV